GDGFDRGSHAEPAGVFASTDRGWRLDSYWSACVAGLSAASLPRARIHLDAWLLGLWAGWILLGARHMGCGTGRRFALDAWILGLGRRRLCLARGLLGSACWILRWHQLWIRLFRSRLRRR